MKHKITALISILAILSIIIILTMTYSFQPSNNNTSDNYEYKDNNTNINSQNEDISFNGHTYDKKEYPKDSYKIEEIYTTRIPSYVVKQFFEDSDFDNNGLLEGKEISAMDYKLKHSQYTYNGPYGYN